MQVHLKLVFGEIRLGPGKADLLAAVARTGSISAAGREMGMSYRRAWLLLKDANALFGQPVIETAAGGAHGGGAKLTPFGAKLLAAYRQVVAQTEMLAAEAFAEITKEP
jgi:molybdate transport system regulatory protein